MWLKFLLLFTFFLLTTSRHLNSASNGNDEISSDVGSILNNTVTAFDGFMKASAAATVGHDGYVGGDQNEESTKIRVKRWRSSDTEDVRSGAKTVWGLSLTIFIIIIVASVICCIVCVAGMIAGIYYLVRKSEPSPQAGGGVVYQAAPAPAPQYGYQSPQPQQYQAPR